MGATPWGPLGLELFSISNWSFTSCSSDFVLKTLERVSDLKMLMA
jgi:hypothetical protein